jgi:uncharacterized damage-inducible protein DinB
MKSRISLTVASLLTIASLALAAGPAPHRAAPAASAEKSPIHQELLMPYDHASDELQKLAEAMPAEKYSWRPSDGVRSVGEVYVHIGNANHLLLGFINNPGRTHDQVMKEVQEYEQREKSMTSKDSIVAYLKESLVMVHNAMASASAADLAKPVNMFGQKTTARGAYIFIIDHTCEHLGQSIAYARVNGVVPPWSRPQPGKSSEAGAGE